MSIADEMRDEHHFNEIASSHCLTPKGSGPRQLMHDYSRDFLPAEWGSGVSLRGSNSKPLMSALGQNRTSQSVWPMSALPPKADIGTRSRDVRFVPKADIAPLHSITSSARLSNVAKTVSPSALAVLRLMARSNFVGCWTGKSAGFIPAKTFASCCAF
jgi:hypothetical protein